MIDTPPPEKKMGGVFCLFVSAVLYQFMIEFCSLLSVSKLSFLLVGWFVLIVVVVDVSFVFVCFLRYV